MIQLNRVVLRKEDPRDQYLFSFIILCCKLYLSIPILCSTVFTHRLVKITNLRKNKPVNM